MYVFDYGILFYVRRTCYDACGLMVSYLSMCQVMGLHMHISLVDRDQDGE